ncbi:ABC transporter ATP-binding protein [bacterium]|nr:ABC transporter ATP-binding protein [bacterium]
MANESVLDVRQISWCTRGSFEQGAILDRCSVNLRSGDWVSLVGPNGSGKSTLLQLISGNLGFSQKSFLGEISWRGGDWVGLSARERATRVAYVSSEMNSVFPLKVSEVVSSGAFASGSVTGLAPAIEFCDLTALADRRIDSLSSGERQRVALARALVQGAEVLFLDEALSNMDLDFQLDIGSRLKSVLDGTSSFPFRLSGVVLVSHDLTLSLRWANQAWVIHRGKILSSGPVKEALSEDVLRIIYPKAAPSLLLQK